MKAHQAQQNQQFQFQQQMKVPSVAKTNEKIKIEMKNASEK